MLASSGVVIHDQGMPELYLYVKEAAKVLKVSNRRVLELIAEGRFPGAIKVGRLWRIPYTEVKGFTPNKRGPKRKKRGRPRKSG